MLKQLAVCAALVSATGTVARAGNGTNLTKYVADTTQVMLVVDVAGAKGSKLVQDSFTKLLDTQPDARAKLAEIGLDPLRDIDTLALSFGGVDEISSMKDTSSMVIIVEGRLPKDAMINLKGATRSTVSGVDVFTKDDTEGAIIDKRLFFAKKGHIGDVIALAKGTSKANLATSAKGKELREVLKVAPTKSHMWGAFVLPQKDRDKTMAAQLPVNAFSMGFTFSTLVAGTLRLETPSAPAAEKMLGMLQAALPQVSQMMGAIGLSAAAKTISLKQDKAAVSGTVSVTETELKSLFALAAMASKSAPAPTKNPAPVQTPPSGGLGSPKKN